MEINLKKRGITNDTKSISIPKTPIVKDVDSNNDCDSNLIKPTHFGFYGEFTLARKKDVYNGNNVYVRYYSQSSGKNARTYCQYADLIEELRYNGEFTKIDTRVLAWFSKNLNYNSNFIKCSGHDISRDLNVTSTSVFASLRKLRSFNILERNEELNGYLINHNLMLKGSSDTFMRHYAKLYPDNFKWQVPANFDMSELDDFENNDTQL